MDEQDLSRRLADAAAVGQPQPPPVADDVARGRRSRRRRVVALTGLPVAAAALLGAVSTAAGLPGPVLGGEPTGPLGVAGGGSSPRPASPTPGMVGMETLVGPTTPEFSNPVSVPVTPPGTLTTTPSPPIPPTPPAKVTPGTETTFVFGPGYRPETAWRHALFALARQHLDPAHERLNYDTQSLQSGTDGSDRMYGIKLGWQQPGESGEGMVQLGVSDPGAAGLLRCGQVAPCKPVHVAGFGWVRLGGDPRGPSGYEVVVRQHDGEVAQVLVTPLFGNDSLIETRAHLPGLDQVLALAEDPRFNLPPH